MFPVTPTTTYVNIGAFPLKGDIEFVLNKVNIIPGVTVPETEGLTELLLMTNVVPEPKVLLATLKLGLIVYEDDV